MPDGPEKLRVLIIDDSPPLIQTIGNLLRRQGYQVDTAASGEEGVQKAREFTYHLVISDIRMPGIDGIETVKLIQQEVLKKGAKTGFMFLTGYSDETAFQKALQLGVTDIMLKPFDLNGFLTAVKKNLEDAAK
ncbi:MAG TPA: response regulator [bacterium]|nr:response regulator [bacterium]